MKLAAVKALAELTKTSVPDIVNMAYAEKNKNINYDVLRQSSLWKSIKPPNSKSSNENLSVRGVQNSFISGQDGDSNSNQSK